MAFFVLFSSRILTRHFVFSYLALGLVLALSCTSFQQLFQSICVEDTDCITVLWMRLFIMQLFVELPEARSTRKTNTFLALNQGVHVILCSPNCEGSRGAFLRTTW